MFGFVEGVIRWHVLVTAYALTLVTDRYPPNCDPIKRSAQIIRSEMLAQQFCAHRYPPRWDPRPLAAQRQSKVADCRARPAESDAIFGEMCYSSTDIATLDPPQNCK